MALVESNDLSIGMKMPDFELSDPEGRLYRRQALCGARGLLIIFTCNHCPYAIAVWDRLIRIANKYEKKGINTVAINPNINPAYPEDGPENMARLSEERALPFPYLIDETQEIARLYDAQCTPDIYLVSAENELVYHGRIDDNWKDESRVTTHELADAMDVYCENGGVVSAQYPSMGCSIKWV